MIGLLFILVASLPVLAFVGLSVRYGVDSRPESNDPRRSEYAVGIS